MLNQLEPQQVLALVIVGVLVLGLLITVAPLGIWGRTAKTCRLLEQQNRLLGELLDREEKRG